MPKLYSLSLTALLVAHLHVNAQYADNGTASLKNQIYWCNWAGFNITEGATKTFMTSDSLTVTATFSDVSGATPIPNYMSYAGYDFNNQSIKTSLNTSNTAHFNITFTATRNGAPAPLTIALTGTGSTTFTTTGSTFNALSGSTTCNANTAHIANTSTILGTTTTRLDVTLQNTSTAIFGILAAFDRGHLPTSYGYAAHEINYTPSTTCTLSQQNNHYLGALPPDSDTTKLTDDAITTFPPYDGGGVYTMEVPVTTTNTAYLSAWFDFNRNGTFESNELTIDTLAAGATTASLTWTGLPTRLPAGKVSLSAFRFRISGTPITSPNGYAPDGEIEDYCIALKAPCDVKVTTLSDVIICSGKSTQLSASGATRYQWTPATSLSADTIAQPIAAPTSTTTYTVNGTDTLGCTGSTSLTISVNPSPVITTSKDTMMCSGTTIQLSGVSDIPASYTWSPAKGLSDVNSTNPGASPDTTTAYTITASTIYSCRTSKTIHINVTPTPEFKVVPANPAVCIGQSVVITAQGGDVFSWLAGDDSVWSANPSIEVAPLHDTLFRIAFEDYTCHITDTLLMPVIVYDTPKTTIMKSADIDCANASVTLKATGGVYYTWEMAPGITNMNTATPVVSPLETTTYEVTIMDEHGCTNVETITVDVDVALSFTRFPIPSAFSPNGDGRNDCFGLKRWGETAYFEFDIFNRAGRIVFSSHSPTDCWDGTFHGEPLPAGAYIYMIRARTMCGDVVRKGAVTLIR